MKSKEYSMLNRAAFHLCQRNARDLLIATLKGFSLGHIVMSLCSFHSLAEPASLVLVRMTKAIISSPHKCSIGSADLQKACSFLLTIFLNDSCFFRAHPVVQDLLFTAGHHLYRGEKHWETGSSKDHTGFDDALPPQEAWWQAYKKNIISHE